MPVPSYDGHQVFLTFVFYALILGFHDHTVCRFGSTGSDQIALAFDLNHTDATAFAGLFRHGIFYFVFAMENGLDRRAVLGRWQVRMVA
jgi:hypothetical protein